VLLARADNPARRNWLGRHHWQSRTLELLDSATAALGHLPANPKVQLGQWSAEWGNSLAKALSKWWRYSTETGLLSGGFTHHKIEVIFSFRTSVWWMETIPASNDGEALEISPTSGIFGQLPAVCWSRRDGEGNIVRGKYEYALTNQEIAVSIYGHNADARQKVLVISKSIYGIESVWSILTLRLEPDHP